MEFICVITMLLLLLDMGGASRECLSIKDNCGDGQYCDTVLHRCEKCTVICKENRDDKVCKEKCPVFDLTTLPLIQVNYQTYTTSTKAPYTALMPVMTVILGLLCVVCVIVLVKGALWYKKEGREQIKDTNIEVAAPNDTTPEDQSMLNVTLYIGGHGDDPIDPVTNTPLMNETIDCKDNDHINNDHCQEEPTADDHVINYNQPQTGGKVKVDDHVTGNHLSQKRESLGKNPSGNDHVINKNQSKQKDNLQEAPNVVKYEDNNQLTQRRNLDTQNNDELSDTTFQIEGFYASHSKPIGQDRLPEPPTYREKSLLQVTRDMEMETEPLVGVVQTKTNTGQQEAYENITVRQYYDTSNKQHMKSVQQCNRLAEVNSEQITHSNRLAVPGKQSEEPQKLVDSGYNSNDNLNRVLEDIPTKEQPHPNKRIYNLLKGIDFVEGYYSEGQSIEVYYDLNKISPNIAIKELVNRTGAPRDKFHLKLQEENLC